MKSRLSRILIFLLAFGLLWGGGAALLCGGNLCLHTPVNAQSAPQGQDAADVITGLAILGDSTQDEYQADSARGGEYVWQTYNWVELIAKYRDLNMGEWGVYGEPRRSGYAYNWARSGATSGEMISNGQLTGALRQVLAHKVSHALVQIGINDFYFSGLGYEIYDGTISTEDLHAILDKTARNIIVTAFALQKLDGDHVIVAAVQDYVTLPIIPELKTTFTDEAGRARLQEAFTYINGRLKELSQKWDIPYFDYNEAMLAALTSRIDSDGYLVMGGERINLDARGNEPHFGMLDDQYAHPGTVISGLSANVWMAEMNKVFGSNLAPLSDEEILQAAGLRQ
jgi:lysophospholipase L1-like esterase